VQDYGSLYAFSVDNIPAFWSELWDYLGIAGDKGTEIVSGLPNTTGANIFHVILGLLGIAACAHGIFIPQGARHDDHTGPASKGF